MSVLKYLNDTQTARLWAKIKAGFVAKSGDTMTGALTLAGDPVSDLQAATKKYVDDNAGGGENIYIAEFDVATASEVENAYEGGKAVYIKYNISTLSYIYPVTSINTNSTSMIIYCVASDGRRLFYINKSTGSWSAGDAYTFAKASSPAFTGTPTAPTAASGTDTTQIATTAFVQDALESVDALPSQTGQSGKFLTTNGTDASWEDVDSLPSQTGQSGKYLTTNGTSASWATVDALPSQSGKNGKYLQTNGTAASWEDGPDNSFYAEYGVATLAQVEAAYDAGKYVYTTYQIDENITLHAPLVLVYPSTGVSFAAYDGENIELLGLSLYGWERYLTRPLDSAGGTMTGALTLSGAPTSNLHAATKKYVDDYVGDIETLLASI